MKGAPVEKIEYEMRGKLSSGGVSARRFTSKGQLELPAWSTQASD
jgi:hypothetical protein